MNFRSQSRLVIVVVLSILWTHQMLAQECKSNKDCRNGKQCGSIAVQNNNVLKNHCCKRPSSTTPNFDLGPSCGSSDCCHELGIKCTQPSHVVKQATGRSCCATPFANFTCNPETIYDGCCRGFRCDKKEKKCGVCGLDKEECGTKEDSLCCHLYNCVKGRCQQCIRKGAACTFEEGVNLCCDPLIHKCLNKHCNECNDARGTACTPKENRSDKVEECCGSLKCKKVGESSID